MAPLQNVARQLKVINKQHSCSCDSSRKNTRDFNLVTDQTISCGLKPIDVTLSRTYVAFWKMRQSFLPLQRDLTGGKQLISWDVWVQKKGRRNIYIAFGIHLGGSLDYTRSLKPRQCTKYRKHSWCWVVVSQAERSIPPWIWKCWGRQVRGQTRRQTGKHFLGWLQCGKHETTTRTEQTLNILLCSFTRFAHKIWQWSLNNIITAHEHRHVWE